MTTPLVLDVASLRAKEFAWMNADSGIYFNAASVGPMPQSAVETSAQWAAYRAQPHTQPFSMLQTAASTARQQFAALVGASAEEIALMSNTTYGLNLAARALPLKPGVILTFDGEFPSCVYPFQALASRGVSLEFIPRREGLPDEDALVEAIHNRKDVVAVVVSWVQFATGFVADLERIGRACESRDVFFVVDGIQGCGVRPLNLHALPIDIFSAGAQKWQLGPWGTGFVYVRKDLIGVLEPHDVGWACMKSSADYTRLTDYEYDFVDDARRFEVVTLAYHDFAVANAATALLLELKTDSIAAHIELLASRLFNWIDSRSDVRAVTPADPLRRAGVLSFTSASASPSASSNFEQMAARLRSARISHVVREGAIRLSPHCYNTIEEMDRVIEVLDQGT